MSLAEHHANYLLDHAIDLELAEGLGVMTTPGGIIFPYRQLSGITVPVFRPDESTNGVKYVSPKGTPPGFNVIREGNPILIVEGTKQALAAASWADDTVGVVGMNGCWGWSIDKHPHPDLYHLVEGRHVVLCFDADWRTNPDVGKAARLLTKACEEVGTLDVRLMSFGGEGTEGLDDALAKLKPAWRPATIQRWIERAEPASTEPEDGYVDIIQLLAEEEPENPWLFRDVLVRGFGHVIYAPRENQKSLFTLWMLVDLIRTRDDVHVLYLDYEMGRFNLRRRLRNMGFEATSPETGEIAKRLHYWPFPALYPLDTDQGGTELERRVRQLVADDIDLVIVIDTTIRANQGRENDSDTIADFTRFTAKRINAISEEHGGNITWIRVDHAGKDVKKGQRGSSAKGDDVGMIWQIRMTGEGIELTNEKDREGFLDNKRITFARQQDPVLTFTRTNDHLHPTAMTLVNLMDEADLPLDISRRQAMDTLTEGHGRPEFWSKAIDFRKRRAQEQ